MIMLIFFICNWKKKVVVVDFVFLKEVGFEFDLGFYVLCVLCDLVNREFVVCVCLL